MKNLVFLLESPTKAIRVKNMFLKAGINARIIRLDDKSQGCTHGVRINEENIVDCVGLLRKNNIRYQTRMGDGLS